MGWRIADYVSDGIWPSQSGNTIHGGELYHLYVSTLAKSLNLD